MTTGISVVIPTYNSAGFLRATLDSVFAQTVPPGEVIVVDDGSTDGTPELVEAAARSAPVPLRLLRGAGNSGGPARPLNQGIARAGGDVIATLDHDDLMLPTKLERQARCLQTDQRLGLVFARCALGPGGEATVPVLERMDGLLAGLRREPLGGRAYRIPARPAHEALVWGNFALSCSNLLFPKSTWRACGGFDERLRCSCDYGFLRDVTARYDLGFVDEPLVVWTPRARSLSRSVQQLRRIRENVAVCSKLERRFLSAHWRGVLRYRLRAELLTAARLAWCEGAYGSSLGFGLAGLGWGARSLLAKLAPRRFWGGVGPGPQAAGPARGVMDSSGQHAR